MSLKALGALFFPMGVRRPWFGALGRRTGRRFSAPVVSAFRDRRSRRRKGTSVLHVFVPIRRPISATKGAEIGRRIPFLVALFGVRRPVSAAKGAESRAPNRPVQSFFQNDAVLHGSFL